MCHRERAKFPRTSGEIDGPKCATTNGWDIYRLLCTTVVCVASLDEDRAGSIPNFAG